MATSPALNTHDLEPRTHWVRMGRWVVCPDCGTRNTTIPPRHDCLVPRLRRHQP